MPMPLLVGRVQVGKVLLVDRLGTSQALSMKAGGIFLSVSRSRLAGEFLSVANTGWEGCKTLSNPGNSGTFFSSAGFDVWCVFGMLVELVVWGLPSSSSSERIMPQKTSSSVKKRYHPHLPLTLECSLLKDVACP